MKLFHMVAPLALGLAALTATPASAAMTVNPNGTITVSGNGGGSVVANMNGSANSQLVNGLSGVLTLTFESAVNGVYTFAYTLANNSKSPVTSSRITAFGFNTDPNIVANGARVLSGGVFSEIRYDTNVPNGVGNVELCFTTQNCAGGGGDGLTMGQNSSGRFSLQFGNANLQSLTLGNIVLRYQSLNAPGLNGASGTGTVSTLTAAVPEPGTWAMMLLGFGAIGFSMRRRRPVALLQAA